MSRWIGILALTVFLAACGAPQLGESTATSSSNLTLSSGEIERVEADCSSVVEGLIEGDTGLIVTSLEDLDATLSGLGAEDLRQHIHSSSDALPPYGDTPPSDADLAEAAPGLIKLSNGLAAAGADHGSCVGIGEVAASFDTRVADDESISERLAAARESWAEAAISTYSVVLSPGPMDSFEDGCGTGGSLLVQVVEGRVEKAVDRLAGCQISLDDTDRVPLTVEDLFALVESNLDADVLEVDFEPELGYPRSVFIQDKSGFTEMSVMSLTPGEADMHSAEELLDELEQQRSVWADRDVTDYIITVEIGCFCPEEFRGPFEVTVVEGDIDTVTMNGTNVQPVDATFLTVEGLFSTIEDYAYSDEINVTYSPDGYPTIIDIDPSRNTIDEELRIDVHDLRINNP